MANIMKKMEKNNDKMFSKMELLETVLQTEITRYFPKSQVNCKTIEYINKFFRECFYFNLIRRIIEYISKKCREINILIKTQLNLKHDIVFHYFVFAGTKRIRFFNQLLNLHLPNVKFFQSVKKEMGYALFGCGEYMGKKVLIISLGLIYDIIHTVELKYDLFKLRRLYFTEYIIPIIKNTLTHEILHKITGGWDLFSHLTEFDFLDELINTFLEINVIGENKNFYGKRFFVLGYNKIIFYNHHDYPFLDILFLIFSKNYEFRANFCIAKRKNMGSSSSVESESFLVKKFTIIYNSMISNTSLRLIRKDAVDWARLSLEFELLYNVVIKKKFEIFIRLIKPRLRSMVVSRFLIKIRNHSKSDQTVYFLIVLIFLHIILKYFLGDFESEIIYLSFILNGISNRLSKSNLFIIV